MTSSLVTSHYLEHTQEGHDKWWAIIPNKKGGFTSYHGARGRVAPRVTKYTYSEGYEKLTEKLNKGYRERTGMNHLSLSDLNFIQNEIRKGKDGWKELGRMNKGIEATNDILAGRKKAGEAKKALKKAREFDDEEDFMTALQRL